MCVCARARARVRARACNCCSQIVPFDGWSFVRSAFVSRFCYCTRPHSMSVMEELKEGKMDGRVGMGARGWRGGGGRD